MKYKLGAQITWTVPGFGFHGDCSTLNSALKKWATATCRGSFPQSRTKHWLGRWFCLPSMPSLKQQCRGKGNLLSVGFFYLALLDLSLQFSRNSVAHKMCLKTSWRWKKRVLKCLRRRKQLCQSSFVLQTIVKPLSLPSFYSSPSSSQASMLWVMFLSYLGLWLSLWFRIVMHH